ncbi:hypothetical protein [Leifsonia aquatica]|uniref:hypothetical protein n=1 Tax=Leifsonia aquatica TaxID=144185 RepID=UPI0028AE05D7|nr:hypothetical protein [Leifsonia aquatica]
MTTGVPAITGRAATADDALGIAQVHVTSWREAYARQLPDDLLAGLDVQRRAQLWTGIIESGDTASTCSRARTVREPVRGCSTPSWARPTPASG